MKPNAESRVKLANDLRDADDATFIEMLRILILNSDASDKRAGLDILLAECHRRLEKKK